MSDIILYIDDELIASSYYKRALESVSKKLRVDYHSTPRSAFEAAKKLDKSREGGGRIKLVVFDILMPPEDGDDSTFGRKMTRDGVKAGVVLYQLLRQLPSLAKIPMFALTNLQDQNILGELKRESNLEVFSKFDVPPFELAEKVRSKLKGAIFE